MEDYNVPGALIKENGLDNESPSCTLKSFEQIDRTGVNMFQNNSPSAQNNPSMENMSAFETSENLSKLNQTQYYRNFGSNGLVKNNLFEATDTEISKNYVVSEPLLGGFALLRVVQLLNFDIYYLGLSRKVTTKKGLNDNFVDPELAKTITTTITRVQTVDSFDTPEYTVRGSQVNLSDPKEYYETFLDELASYNPLQKYINKYSLLNGFCRLLKICLSLFAIIIGIDKTISNIILCFTSNIESKGGDAQEQANSSMGLSVLILVNISSIYILFSTVFNGHLLWNLLSQRLFLVSEKFQCKTMLILLIFVYLEYVVSIAFVNNLYEWDFTSNNIQSGSYSVFANLRIFLTEQDEEHYYIDILLTIIQFARGIIRISPYITINYAIICLKEHIKTIRNQHLLTDSLKKKQKLRLVVSNRNKKIQDGKNGKDVRKKRVNFVTNLNGQAATSTVASLSGDEDARRSTLTPNSNDDDIIKHFNQEHNLRERESLDSIYLIKVRDRNIHSSGNISTISSRNSFESSHQQNPLDRSNKLNANGGYLIDDLNNKSNCLRNTNYMNVDLIKEYKQFNHNNKLLSRYKRGEEHSNIYLKKIKDFDELESYITNLYIFTGRLNRVMSRQGLTVFFIVHNLVITVSLIVPEAVRGGIIMAYIIRFLVILIGIMPFVIGESLNEQLEQLSKQIDRIIIQQQFIYTRRDNLVRIRELIHDIRVNCGGMLDFNMETGIKYLVVAFASAFFIEQERKYSVKRIRLVFLNIKHTTTRTNSSCWTRENRISHSNQFSRKAFNSFELIAVSRLITAN